MRADLRGSGGEGRARESEVSGNVGRAEIKDLSTVIRSLLAKYSFFNPEKICICGWGVSGFYVLKALAEEGTEYFNCGIAVAPVANWMIAGEVMTFIHGLWTQR
jgi:dipeptidyl aminopeptidase/acylaminoacyl peptidase